MCHLTPCCTSGPAATGEAHSEPMERPCPAAHLQLAQEVGLNRISLRSCLTESFRSSKAMRMASGSPTSMNATSHPHLDKMSLSGAQSEQQPAPHEHKTAGHGWGHLIHTHPGRFRPTRPLPLAFPTSPGTLSRLTSSLTHGGIKCSNHTPSLIR